MADQNNPFSSQLPTVWAAAIPIIAGQVRGIVQLANGFGFAWAYGVNGDKVQMAVTFGVAMAFLAWSGYQKVKTLWALYRAANAPAGVVIPKVPL